MTPDQKRGLAITVIFVMVGIASVNWGWWGFAVVITTFVATLWAGAS